MPGIPRARTGSRSTPRRALALLASAALLAGCGPSTSTPSDPAATLPELWFAARASAQRQGVENLVSFYDPDLVLDYRALGHEPITGRADALEHLHLRWQIHAISRAPDGKPYLSQDAAVTGERVGGDPVAFVTTMAATGASREMLAPSLLLWRQRDPQDARPSHVQALATAYVAAWSGGSAQDVAELYDQAAELDDSLLGVSAAGGRAIGSLAARGKESGGLKSATLEQLPDYAGPAVFAAGLRYYAAPIDTIVLMLGFADPDACPGQMAVQLTVDPAGLILREHRYHRVDALQRCSAEGALPPGWWDSIQVPDPVPFVRTGTLRIDDMDVAVYNGTPGLEGLVRWGYQRFGSAGLATPRVTRITFHDRKVDQCEGLFGVILTDAVTLCFDAEVICADQACSSWRPVAKRTLLHELAHAWMADNVSETTISEFLRATGKVTWASSDHPWEHRGVELGAETIAWALMDEPMTVYEPLGTPTCADLAGYYQILTGRPPEPTPPGCQPTPPD